MQITTPPSTAGPAVLIESEPLFRKRRSGIAIVTPRRVNGVDIDARAIDVAAAEWWVS
jgi:hypothetical protein